MLITTSRRAPDVTSQLHLGRAPPLWSCPMITGLWWTWWPSPGHILTLVQHPATSPWRSGWGCPRLSCWSGGMVGQALAVRPAPWGAAVTPVTRRKKQYINTFSAPPDRFFQQNTPPKVLLGLILPPDSQTRSAKVWRKGRPFLTRSLL